jgi:hypothetical protein
MPKIIRCPYCVEPGPFMPMSARNGGNWFVCDSCGHLALPGNPMYKCTCVHCVRIEEAQYFGPGVACKDSRRPFLYHTWQLLDDFDSSHMAFRNSILCNQFTGDLQLSYLHYCPGEVTFT